MNSFEKFIVRYHQVKKGIQEQEERELANATGAYQSAMNALVSHELALKAAKQRQSACGLASADFHAWSTYVLRLESQLKMQHEKVAVTFSAVGTHRVSVKNAFIDQEKWSLLVEQQKQINVEAQHVLAIHQADENAVIRHGRSE